MADNGQVPTGGLNQKSNIIDDNVKIDKSKRRDLARIPTLEEIMEECTEESVIASAAEKPPMGPNGCRVKSILREGQE